MPTQTQTALLDAVDRIFDLADKTLAAQRQFARTLVGAAERQADAIAETVESTSRETLRDIQATVKAEAERAQRAVERVEPAPAPEPVKAEQPEKAEADKPKARKQEPKVDRRPFEDRSLDELRERARELDIEGRSAMSKDELVAALRKQGK